MTEAILMRLYMIPAILIGFTFHEYAHAFVADKLGDKTPKFQGRLTLNPIAHIDPIGFIMILIFKFGWAKPVEINPNAFKNRYKDDLKVTFAGPLANLVVALIFSFLMLLFDRFSGTLLSDTTTTGIIYYLFYYTIYINVMLFFFNLIPIPGLDGFHIFRDLFPKQFYKISDTIYRYQLLILIIFIATPISTYIIGVPTSAVVNLFLKVASMIV